MNEKDLQRDDGPATGNTMENEEEFSYTSGEITGKSPMEQTLDQGLQFLEYLQKRKETYRAVKLYFHNDMDGFASSLLVNHLLTKIGYEIPLENIHPLAHVNLNNVAIDEQHLFFFVDIRPPSSAFKESSLAGEDRPFMENVFCVDHHTTLDSPLSPHANFFLYNYEIDDILPSTATFLMYYLVMLEKGIRGTYGALMREWMTNPPMNTRYLLLQATIADHLHLLSEKLPNNPLRYLSNLLIEDMDAYVLLSITTSLLLGGDGGHMDMFRQLYSEALGNINQELMAQKLENNLSQVLSLFEFVDILMKKRKEFIDDMAKDMDGEIQRTEAGISGMTDTLNNYNTAADKIKEELSFQNIAMGKLKDLRNDYMGIREQMTRLENQIGIELGRLEKQKVLRYHLVAEGDINLSVFLPPQNNDQVRGILSSLLFYHGNNNIIIEEKTSKAVWSSRGYEGKELESFLTTVSVDMEKLMELKEHQEAVEEFKGDPTIIEKLELDERSPPLISVENRYIGQMGGRSRIFGGIITSNVTLDASTLVQDRGGNELQSILTVPHQRFWISTIQAIKEKFKESQWFTVQVEGGASLGEILSDQWELLLMHFMGNRMSYRIFELKSNGQDGI